MRSAAEVTLPLGIDRGAGEPIPVQLSEQLRDLIGHGVLAPGDQLPSSRALAAHLRISRGSVVAAYDQLLAEGYLGAAPGRSTVVNPQVRRIHPRPRPVPARAAAPASSLIDLTPGQPWSQDVVTAVWKSAWRQASAMPVGVPMPALGLPELRAAWSEHLRRMRAVVRDPGQIAVTAGGREGFALLLLALAGGRSPGDAPLRVGVEDPGYPSLRRVPARLGAATVPLPVDDHGLRVADLPVGDAAPDVVLVTPSHQYPLGGSLPVDRRLALLDWAHAHGVVVVEDDYDSELRYTSQPLPALASLDDPDAGDVVLLGTLSKTLTPALATGFLALPRRLVEAVSGARRELGMPVGLVPQRAVAEYLRSGALRLHTQRMRNRYRRRRARVVAALSGVPGATVYPMDGGLHAVVETTRPEAEVVAGLARAGVTVSPLSRYWLSHQAASSPGGAPGTRSGIVFGFGAVSDEVLETVLRLIRSEVDPDAPRPGCGESGCRVSGSGKSGSR